MIFAYLLIFKKEGPCKWVTISMIILNGCSGHEVEVSGEFIFRLSSPDGQNENFTVRHDVDDQNPQLSSVGELSIVRRRLSGACLLA